MTTLFRLRARKRAINQPMKIPMTITAVVPTVKVSSVLATVSRPSLIHVLGDRL